MELSVKALESRQRVEASQLEEIRTRLIEALQTEDYSAVSSRTSDLNRYRGRVEIISYVLVIVRHNESLSSDELYSKIQTALVQLLTRGADDAWSGRGNDEKRALHDGRLEVIGEIL